jgi:aryl-alcohol dehydrogenase-like predicted oxidoreductase
MSLESLHVPNSSVAISRLGFGCARIFGGRERRQAATLIETAIRCGVRHFDTAPSYGSEDVLGEILGDARGITIATKIGIPRRKVERSPARRVFGPVYRRTLRPLLGRVPTLKPRLLRLWAKSRQTRTAILKRQLHRGEVLRELDESLRRLRRTAIDLYLLHEPEVIEMTDELQDVFLSLQKDGVVRSFGLAFGSQPTEHASFGTVVQCGFPGNAGAPVPRHDTLRIYHGTVRFGLQSRSVDGTRPDAGDLISRALAQHPAAAIIFSASVPRQIRQLSEACFGLQHAGR